MQEENLWILFVSCSQFDGRLNFTIWLIVCLSKLWHRAETFFLRKENTDFQFISAFVFVKRNVQYFPHHIRDVFLSCIKCRTGLRCELAFFSRAKKKKWWHDLHVWMFHFLAWAIIITTNTLLSLVKITDNTCLSKLQYVIVFLSPFK